MTEQLTRRLDQHPCWSHLVAGMQVERGTILASGRAHHRIELLTAGYAPERIAAILRVRIACAACGAAICPFRSRRRKSAGRAERPGRMYVSVACELSESVGCSRGSAASAEVERLCAAIHRAQQPQAPAQLQLGGML